MKEKLAKIVERYAHDFRDMAMNEDDLRNMIEHVSDEVGMVYVDYVISHLTAENH